MTLIQRLKVAVKDLIAAEIANSWKGGGDPQDVPIIELELRLQRRIFNEVVRLIEEQQKK